MTEQITYSQLLELVRDPETTDDELLNYFQLDTGQGGFDFCLRVNPNTVIMTEADAEFENAMQIGNGIERYRRRLRFYSKKRNYPERPVILSEGDSWFQFPLLIQETIDHLSDHFNVWSLGAAGDTLANMTEGNPRKHGFEFLIGLRQLNGAARAFLFSAAGNDILGEDPGTKLPMLEPLLVHFNGDERDVQGHIDHKKLDDRLTHLEAGYLRMIDLVRNETGCENLPIVVHGYDYAFPYPFGSQEHRNPIYAANDQWLGRAFTAKGIEESNLRRSIIIHLVDRLYEMLNGLSEKASSSGIWVVDCRGAMPDLTDWADEIHGNSRGFAEVGRRFRITLDKAIAHSGGET
ncbi:hypothetical protein KL867_05205 [Ruegeria litorea]|uniref:GDSL-like Lipase/Acylhydrolase family protein n=1 Tax=Falsiruegeria litorea TaxID=1280831 RepID=A0ABS5WMS4_9RHOB|nr:hypothetical protein [Falsiruegeria litorea]MBT3140437.1 hypothetical protein [Falsiruegeria litorea]